MYPILSSSFSGSASIDDPQGLFFDSVFVHYIYCSMMILGNLIVNPVYYYDHLNSEEKSLIRKLRGRLGMLFGFHVIFLCCVLEVNVSLEN